MYRFQPGRGKVSERRLTVYFKDGVLDRVIGDIEPADPWKKGKDPRSRSGRRKPSGVEPRPPRVRRGTQNLYLEPLMSEQRIAIAGCTGRMGRMLIEATLKGDGVRLVAAFDQPGNPFVGRDARRVAGRRLRVAIGDSAAAAIAEADCLIDFTRPEGNAQSISISASDSARPSSSAPLVFGPAEARHRASGQADPGGVCTNMAVEVNVRSSSC